MEIATGPSSTDGRPRECPGKRPMEDCITVSHWFEASLKKIRLKIAVLGLRSNWPKADRYACSRIESCSSKVVPVCGVTHKCTSFAPPAVTNLEIWVRALSSCFNHC